MKNWTLEVKCGEYAINVYAKHYPKLC